MLSTQVQSAIGKVAMPKIQRVTFILRGKRVAIPVTALGLLLFLGLGGAQKTGECIADGIARYLIGGSDSDATLDLFSSVEAREPRSGDNREPELELSAPAPPVATETGPSPQEEMVISFNAFAAGTDELETPSSELSQSTPPSPGSPPPTHQAVPAQPGKDEEAQSPMSPRLREVYTAQYLRDPFYSLIASEEAKPGKLLDISKAKMVGSVWGESGMIALLEDDRGRSYALKEGDRVLNGKVVSVKPGSVTFSITIFGLTKQVTLEIAEEGEW